MELLTHLEARSQQKEPANIWFSLLIAAFERSWLEVKNKAIRPVKWIVNLEDHLFSAHTNTTMGSLKTILAETLGKEELQGSLYMDDSRLSSTKTFETLIHEPYNLAPGSTVDLRFKEKKEESTKKRKTPQEPEQEKSTKKLSKSKN